MSEKSETVEMPKEILEDVSVKLEKCAVLLNSTANKILADPGAYTDEESVYSLSHLMEFVGKALQPIHSNLGDYY